MEDSIFEFIKKEGIAGYSSRPQIIETVISRVFVFDAENRALKFYKRDNEWWNREMNNLSSGATRREFIQGDFEFNHFLNPATYLTLQVAVFENGVVVLRDPEENDDELVIVMQKEDVSKILTEILFTNTLTKEDYGMIGSTFVDIKLRMPRHFLPKTNLNTYELMNFRMRDLFEWVLSEKSFPDHIARKGLSLFEKMLRDRENYFRSLKNLSVCIDCNAENLLYSQGTLRFLDAYPPRDDWRIGPFEVDIFRTASDIYALAGQEAYRAYLEGVIGRAGEQVDIELSEFYLLYGALIMTPYLYMRSKNDERYLPKAEKYTLFIEGIVS